MRYDPTREKSLGYSFGRVKQFFRQFFRITLRWIVSCLLCGAIAKLLLYYASLASVLDRQQRYMFNALYVGFSLMLALNIVVCVQPPPPRHPPFLSGKVQAGTD